MYKELPKCRLVIATYNSTTYLETMALNIPTIIFWNTNISNVRYDAAPYFNLLKSVGIFHDTPESAASHVALIWDDVDLWWKSLVVQNVRRKFCEQYSDIHHDIVANVAKVLSEQRNIYEKNNQQC